MCYCCWPFCYVGLIVFQVFVCRLIPEEVSLSLSCSLSCSPSFLLPQSLSSTLEMVWLLSSQHPRSPEQNLPPSNDSWHEAINIIGFLYLHSKMGIKKCLYCIGLAIRINGKYPAFVCSDFRKPSPFPDRKHLLRPSFQTAYQTLLLSMGGITSSLFIPTRYKCLSYWTLDPRGPPPVTLWPFCVCSGTIAIHRGGILHFILVISFLSSLFY